MNIWFWGILGGLSGLLLGALLTLWGNYKAEEETNNEMAMVFSKAVVKLRDEIYWREYGFSPIECEEFHLPGDCPLCGAQ